MVFVFKYLIYLCLLTQTSFTSIHSACNSSPLVAVLCGRAPNCACADRRGTGCAHPFSCHLKPGSITRKPETYICAWTRNFNLILVYPNLHGTIDIQALIIDTLDIYICKQYIVHLYPNQTCWATKASLNFVWCFCLFIQSLGVYLSSYVCVYSKIQFSLLFL